MLSVLYVFQCEGSRGSRKSPSAGRIPCTETGSCCQQGQSCWGNIIYALQYKYILCTRTMVQIYVVHADAIQNGVHHTLFQYNMQYIVLCLSTICSISYTVSVQYAVYRTLFQYNTYTIYTCLSTTCSTLHIMLQYSNTFCTIEIQYCINIIMQYSCHSTGHDHYTPFLQC